MIPKYHIEYAIEFGNRKEPQDYQTDDPVAAEEFLAALLERSLKVRTIKHEGVELPPREFDRMIKKAAESFVAKHIGRSLSLDNEQVHYRFGYAA
jgi:hypothetical protein